MGGGRGGWWSVRQHALQAHNVDEHRTMQWKLNRTEWYVENIHVRYDSLPDYIPSSQFLLISFFLFGIFALLLNNFPNLFGLKLKF